MNNNRTFAPMIGASTKTGIDKLVIKTKDFSIESIQESGLKVRQGDVNLSDGTSNNTLLFTAKKDKKQIIGCKAYLNEELFSVNIDFRGLQITFNPSKPYHPYELCSDEESLSERLKNVRNGLSKYGIGMDFDKMELHRIDLTRNNFMLNPFRSYGELFNGLAFKRSKNNSQHNGETYTTYNSGFGMSFYDKGTESNLQYDNLLRGELQFKNPKNSNFKKLQIGIVKDIGQVGFHHLNSVYVEIMKSDVFKTKNFDGQINLNFADQLNILESYEIQYGKRSGIKKFISGYGIENLLSELNGLDGFKHLLKLRGYHRNVISRHVSELHKELNFKSTFSKNKYGKMYRELVLAFAS